MVRDLVATMTVIVLLIGCLCGIIYVGRYQTAVEWVEDGIFSKATPYLDEFPFITELHDPGFVSYAYAGEAMEHGDYEEAIELLKPLAEKNYRDSVQMLEYCMEEVKQTAD